MISYLCLRESVAHIVLEGQEETEKVVYHDV
jgi:hypothetical protein